MKKSSIIVLFIVFYFFSCRTNKSSIQTKEFVYETIHDTIVTINEKLDTFYVYLPQIITNDEIKISKEKSSLVINKKTGSSLMVICREDEFKLKLDSVIKNKFKVITKEKTVYVNKKCDNKFHIFSYYFTIVSLIGLFLLRLFKGND